MNVFRAACVFPAVLLTACSVSKTDNPLAPTVAGPIVGVSISAPRALLPAAGARIPRAAHPIALVVENASTTGERPIAYAYEVGTDPGFATPLFQRTGVAPGADGRTSVELAGPLDAGRTYYWRVQAADGANTGPHSDVAHFTVFEPFVLSAPSLISPVGGATVTSVQPLLRASNAVRSGPAEAVALQEFEVSPSSSFNPLAASGTVDEQVSQTTVVVSPLQPSRAYYWRVRAVSASTTGPWSTTEAFSTPASPVQAPPAGGLPPSNPGPRPGVSEGAAMVSAVIADMKARGIPMSGDCGAFAITRRVAWAFRNRGAGLERKPGGRNCDGHSIDIVIFTDGQTVDMLGGAGDDNTPTWQEHGMLSDWASWWIAPSNPD